MSNTKKEEIQKLCLENNWDFELFKKYVDLIEEKNKIINLTGFSNERLWSEGIWESLLYMLEITKNKKDLSILDVGSGAGFPSIPFALTKPNHKITIYEPLLKRFNFLNEVVNVLKLEDIVKIYRYRVEEVKDKNIYDIVTARAVASVKGMLMSSFHLVKVNGELNLLKGKNVLEEIEDAKEIFKKIKFDLEVTDLIGTKENRDNKIVKIIKLRSTPSVFPFSWKVIKNS
ncbi:16S rRNA (guanine(527)-N(7))-methyltransferase RsmG [Mycoplasma sp. CSL10166]|uniref:16S rRNA (guanine(527)-N(7))-methyltransferase RsmG n=1 Tax=Mycoplasma sp. CSL10166 TaxID=2813825 RepID=UPI00197BA954|nr:16S rRNA (guanine(527)-N(7))-methyltransferase RsmG [Mycoplasma sp. CSL10166]MBN4084532.1 16S rRNA (guanine(527)-N(7))-methyltransferase RsmG [Mycoplasma sp. CSL10166]